MRSIVVIAAVTLLSACGAPVESAPLQRVVVSDDGRSFALEDGSAPFVPFGFNYDHDAEILLLEEYWEDRWADVVQDFDEMQALGATVVRIHLQVGSFMTGPDAMDDDALERLADLVDVARARGIRLDITGLCAYRGSADPAWYVALSEEDRWRAQARFWGAIAERLAGDPAVFALDLMNEPTVPTTVQTDWTPGEFAGLSYVQNLVLDLGGRDPADVAHAWRMAMLAAIRAHDPDVLVTVGQLPFTTQPGFEPDAVAADLDYLSVHVYPDRADLPASITLVETFGAAGAPVVIEETYLLTCSDDQLGDFILASRPSADGWLGFYWGTPPSELRTARDIPSAILLSWLDLFVALRPMLVTGS